MLKPFGPFNEEQMLEFARRLGGYLPTAVTLYLLGDLGAGKTTFSRGLIQSFGHVGAVKSPTFTLLEPYSLPSRQVFHFDLYRLSDPEELEFIGVRDYFDGTSTCLIEWPSCGEGLIPPADLEITLLRSSADSRLVELKANTSLAAGWLAQL
ncbi:MAG: tRNA (adenosine(37)-N6)-threonylcarbamoyltransferase complex ATPase subunit type 1 TsaE [Sinobacterium sp.]|nr:tRNA (adenosine(37)-N6)-threonylcarbamoyltransferase complex ATPase subunit type 1 TsaE [Sinobacterium sp.]